MRAAVIGTGGWGTAISLLLAEGGHEVTFWSRTPQRAAEIAASRENPTYLPGIRIPDSIHVIGDDKDLENHDLYIFAVPSHVVREIAARVAPYVKSDTALYVSASKGVERKSLKRMTEVLSDILEVPDDRVLAFSGPSHAEEVARKIPTVVVAAGVDPNAARTVQNAFTLPYFRVYRTNDVIGVELAGALKNVIAICAGILDGEGYGDNTIAALVTRGIAEIRRLGVALGADGETFAGVAGLGDLVVTCLSKHSRNRRLGVEIGKGRTLQDILKDMKMVAEGVTTTESAKALASKHNIEMPIIEETYRILFEGKDHRLATQDLMQRAVKDERW